MNQFTPNDLTMGPLKAKRKVERNPIKPILRIPTEPTLRIRLVFRCGVRDCPVVFGHVRDSRGVNVVFFRMGHYVKNQGGVFVERRRAATRDEQQRNWRRPEKEMMEMIGAAALDPSIAQSEEARASLAEAPRKGRQYAKRRDPEKECWMEASEFPAFFLCPKCKRRSKIEIADLSAPFAT